MNRMEFKIGKRLIGMGHPCLVIGEVAQSHDGSLGMAHAFIDAIAKSGADAVKFQTHIAAAESTPAEPWRVKFSYQDQTRYQYWKRMEFTEEQWAGLKAHSEDRGLIFLSSAFSLEAANLLERLGMQAWKVASGETSTNVLTEFYTSTHKPILLSTGMSSISEIDAVMNYIYERNVPCAVMQCTTAYPCPPEKVGLNNLALFRERYQCPVGLSDHSASIFPGLAGITLGMQLLEVHVALSREMFGPDVPASLTTDELALQIKGIRYTETMLSNPVNKDEMAQQLQPLRELFTKSLFYITDLPAGTVLREEHIAIKKPGTGLAIDRLPLILGKNLKMNVIADTFVRESDLE
jgi:N,N'-diacetyllegionaminate synthase